MASLDREPSLPFVDNDYSAYYKSLKNMSQHTFHFMKEQGVPATLHSVRRGMMVGLHSVTVSTGCSMRRYCDCFISSVLWTVLFL
uniref:Uncharacterized protein n=1 Tax=Chrysemys picta bellii TaxID=8478 RepID=A0A8C3H993_CHRPI